MDDTELELVRRGFDPGQVQQLVGSLAAELKTMAAENDRLRARVTELEQAPPRPATDSDVFAHWGRETNELLDAARRSINAVTEKATADAAAAVAAGEVAATTIRQRAQLDADQLLADARRRADDTTAEAQREAERIAAEAAAAKAAREAEAQATVDAAEARLAELESTMANLRSERQAMSRRLSEATQQLAQLMSLVDDPDGSGSSDHPGEPAATASDDAPAAELADDES